MPDENPNPSKALAHPAYIHRPSTPPPTLCQETGITTISIHSVHPSPLRTHRVFIPRRSNRKIHAQYRRYLLRGLGVKLLPCYHHQTVPTHNFALSLPSHCNLPSLKLNISSILHSSAKPRNPSIHQHLKRTQRTTSHPYHLPSSFPCTLAQISKIREPTLISSHLIPSHLTQAPPTIRIRYPTPPNPQPKQKSRVPATTSHDPLPPRTALSQSHTISSHLSLPPSIHLTYQKKKTIPFLPLAAHLPTTIATSETRSHVYTYSTIQHRKFRSRYNSTIYHLRLLLDLDIHIHINLHL
jgi:hypothetical protein